jgi:hypothetical protein
MTPHQDLLTACEEWRALSESEGAALRAADWPRVAECQTAKRALQPRINSLADRIQAGPDRPIEPRLRRLVDELIALETRNHEILASQRVAAEREQGALDRARRNLQRVHGSYAGARRPAWESYS